MQYFVIRHTDNIKIIGHYPQVQKVHHNCSVWDEPKFIENVGFKDIDFIPITSNVELHKSSKLTDLIQVTSIGFTNKLLVSEKLMYALKSQNGNTLNFYKSEIYQRCKYVEDYYIMHSPRTNMNLLDFQKSEFVLCKLFEKVKDLNFKDFEDYLEFKSDLKYPLNILASKIHFLPEIKNDLITLIDVGGGVKYVVSEKFKELIENLNCTGIEFMPIEYSLSEWLHSEKRKILYL